MQICGKFEAFSFKKLVLLGVGVIFHDLCGTSHHLSTQKNKNRPWMRAPGRSYFSTGVAFKPRFRQEEKDGHHDLWSMVVEH